MAENPTATFTFSNFEDMHRAADAIGAACREKGFTVPGGVFNPHTRRTEYTVTDAEGAEIGMFTTQNHVTERGIRGGTLTFSGDRVKLAALGSVVDAAVSRHHGQACAAVISR